MGCLLLALGSLALGIALFYLPFLTVKNLAISLTLDGAAFLMGLSVLRDAGKRNRGSFGRIGGGLLMVGSAAVVALVMIITAPRELLNRPADYEASTRTAEVTIEPVLPGPEGHAVDGDITLVIRGGVYSDRTTTSLRLARISGPDETRGGGGAGLRLTSIEDDGHLLRFTPSSPLAYDSIYQAEFRGAAMTGRKRHSISATWEIATGPPTVINGIDPNGFEVVIHDEDTCILQLKGDAVRHGSPAKSIVLYSAHGGANRELARKEAQPGWPTKIDINIPAEMLIGRFLWVAAVDGEDRPAARFRIGGFTDHDGRGVFLVSQKGEYTTPDGVTIHYGRATWQKSSGEPATGWNPTLKIRVESLPDSECLGTPPDGFRVIGCYETSVEVQRSLSKNPRYRDSLTDRSYPGGFRREIVLMPSFFLSIPAPADVAEGTPAIAVVEEHGHQYVPNYRLTGVGRVIEANGGLSVRLLEGGGANSPETVPSGISLGELFEADAMVGRRAILVADGSANTTLVVATGWSRATTRHSGQSYGEQTVTGFDDCSYFTTSFPITYDPPSFGRVRKGDGFVLPMVAGETSLLVRRDPVTGWILDRNEVSVPRSTDWLTDIGSLDDLLEVDRWTGKGFDREINSSLRNFR